MVADLRTVKLLESAEEAAQRLYEAETRRWVRRHKLRIACESALALYGRADAKRNYVLSGRAWDVFCRLLAKRRALLTRTE